MLTAVEAPVRIGVAAVQADGAAWLVAWHVQNLLEQALVLEEAWVPHGRFRGEGHVRLDLEIPPGGATLVHLRVAAHEVPGTLVENAYLILRASQRWRVFARMRVEFDADGTPRPVVEAVTAQSLQ